MFLNILLFIYSKCFFINFSLKKKFFLSCELFFGFCIKLDFALPAILSTLLPPSLFMFCCAYLVHKYQYVSCKQQSYKINTEILVCGKITTKKKTPIEIAVKRFWDNVSFVAWAKLAEDFSVCVTHTQLKTKHVLVCVLMAHITYIP